MLPYYILILVPAVFMVFTDHLTYKTRGFDFKKLILGSFFLLFFIILACRGIEIGVDLDNYQEMFEMTLTRDFFASLDIYRVEIGYRILQYLVGLLTDDFRWVIVVVALFSTIPFWIMYQKESEYPYLTMILFVTVAPFAMFFSGLRQTCAMAFAVPIYYLIKNKKPVWFVIMVLIAALFHKSAIVMLAMYPLYHIKFGRNFAYFFMPITGLCILFNEQILRMVFDTFTEGYFDKYGEITNTGSYTMLILFVIFIVYSYVIPDEETIDDDTRGMRNFLYFIIIVQSFAPVHTIAMRINYYYMLFLPILIPKIAASYDKSTKRLSELSLIAMNVVFTARFFVDMHTSEDLLNIFPYEVFWK